ncbi:MAG TPA: hypothetical protein VIC26_08690 [Marinagarivorans sp.]
MDRATWLLAYLKILWIRGLKMQTTATLMIAITYFLPKNCSKKPAIAKATSVPKNPAGIRF